MGNSKLKNLDDYRTGWWAIQGLNKTAYVIPHSMFERIASGHLKISEVEEFDNFGPTIIKEWMTWGVEPKETG